MLKFWPILLVLFSHLKLSQTIQPIEYFVILVAMFLLFYNCKYTGSSRVQPKPQKDSSSLPQMQELKLNEISPIDSKPMTLSNEPYPIIRVSPSKIDSTLQIPNASLSSKPRPTPSIPCTSFIFSTAKPPSLPSVISQTSQIKLPDPNLACFRKELIIKHAEEFMNSNQKIKQEVLADEGLIDFERGMINVQLNISNYFKHIKSLEEESKKRQIIEAESKMKAQARNRIVIEPYEESYQQEILQKCEFFINNLEECKKKIDSGLSTSIKGIVSQITSDVHDQAHLDGRIKAMLDLLASLDPDALKLAVYVLCEAMVDRGLGQADSIDLGSKFSLNYTKFILAIAKSYKQVHEVYFIAIVRRKYLFYPMIGQNNLEEIKNRSELKYNSNGMLSDSEKCKLARSLDVCRAIGYSIGGLLASKESNFNEGDIWRYLVYILNLNIECIDRAYLTFLLGFIKCTNERLMIAYGKQYLKVIEFLSGDFTDNLSAKFGSNPYLKAYITQLKDLLSRIKRECKIN